MEDKLRANGEMFEHIPCADAAHLECQAGEVQEHASQQRKATSLEKTTLPCKGDEGEGKAVKLPPPLC